MDNHEYKLRMDQLLKMLDEEKYSVAAKLADSLDWRRVTNIKNLNIIAKAYRMVKDYEQELEVLQLAYNNSTRGRAILENLIKCAIKLEDLNLSINYYNEYVRLFPSANKYYLKFLLYRLQGASPQDQIALLKDYCNGADEQAMFELAYLYHREGMINQCISMCDDIIMFCHPCEESYKAMELKMRYMPLNEVQMEKYRQKHKNIEAPKPVLKEFEAAKDDDFTDHIVIPEYSVDGETAEKLQEDLSMSIKSIMNNSKDIENSEADIQIPGQMNLQEALSGVKNKKEEAVNMIEQYHNTPKEEESPYLSPEALMRARTKELSVKNIVNSPKVQKPALKPLVALSNTQSLNIINNIKQEFAILKGEKIETLEEKPEATDEKPENQDFLSEERGESDIAQDMTTSSLPENEKETFYDNYEESIDETENEDFGFKENEASVVNLNEDIALPFYKRQEEEPDSDSFEKVEIHDNEAFNSDYDKSEEERQLDIEHDFYNQEVDEKKVRERKREGTEEGEFIKNDVESGLYDEEFKLKAMHKQTLGYLANIPDFNRALAKAIHYLTHGKKYMAISSVSHDNRVNLSKRLIEAAYRELGDSNVKLAISSGKVLNHKDIRGVFEKISGGFLIIDEASALTVPTVDKIYANLLLNSDIGLAICDIEKNLKSLFELNTKLEEIINIKVHLPILTNNELIGFGEEYAQERGYVLDEKAKSAIYDTIGKLRESESIVTVSEIKELIDKAINKKEGKGFNLFGKHKTTSNVLQEKDLLIK